MHLKLLHRLSTFLGMGALLLAMLLHLTLRDQHRLLSVVFYAFPLPLIFLGWLCLAGWNWSHRWLLGVCLVLAVGTAAWWHAVSYRPARADLGELAALKVLYWNMAHQKLPSADLKILLEREKPDIVGLGEVGLRHGDSNPLLATLPPGYVALKPEYGMGLLVRGTVKVLNVKFLEGRSKYVEADATVDGRTWRLVLVDGDGYALRSRQTFLAQVPTAGSPAIILGDFNTPIESRWFDPWRDAGLRHASEGTRQGFRETWPRGWPVMTIDHIWTSRGVRPLRFRMISLPSSDHRALVADLKLESK